MEKNYLFEDKNLKYDEYLMIVQELLNARKNEHQKLTEEGIKSLVNIEEEKIKKIIDVSLKIDRKIGQFSKITGHAFHKKPAIMSAAIMIDKFYDSVKNLTDEQFCLLATTNFSPKISTIEDHVKFIGNKKLLSSMVNKSTDIYYQRSFVLATYEKAHQLDLNKNDNEELEVFYKGMISIIDFNTKEELSKMAPSTSELYKRLPEEVKNTWGKK